MLKFEIVSSRIVEGAESEKKFVAYMLQVRKDDKESNIYDQDPSNVERRYTHFLDLYNGIRKDHGPVLNSLSFPRKMMVGNFEPSLISSRCFAFEALVRTIANHYQTRDALATVSFFQDVELNEAKRLIEEKKFDQALSVLENSYKLLNKLYTERSRVVLAALCRVVAIAEASGGALAGPVERWAQLALRRYEGVSDSDLLLLYVPLLHVCISIWETLGRDKTRLVEELNDLRKRGMKVDDAPKLIDAVDNLDVSV